jgi:hypothetical protein
MVHLKALVVDEQPKSAPLSQSFMVADDRFFHSPPEKAKSYPASALNVRSAPICKVRSRGSGKHRPASGPFTHVNRETGVYRQARHSSIRTIVNTPTHPQTKATSRTYDRSGFVSKRPGSIPSLRGCAAMRSRSAAVLARRSWSGSSIDSTESIAAM